MRVCVFIHWTDEKEKGTFRRRDMKESPADDVFTEHEAGTGHDAGRARGSAFLGSVIH